MKNANIDLSIKYLGNDMSFCEVKNLSRDILGMCVNNEGERLITRGNSVYRVCAMEPKIDVPYITRLFCVTKENFAKSKESQNSHTEHFENSSEKTRNQNYSKLL